MVGPFQFLESLELDPLLLLARGDAPIVGLEQLFAIELSPDHFLPLLDGRELVCCEPVLVLFGLLLDSSAPRAVEASQALMLRTLVHVLFVQAPSLAVDALHTVLAFIRQIKSDILAVLSRPRVSERVPELLHEGGVLCQLGLGQLLFHLQGPSLRGGLSRWGRG